LLKEILPEYILQSSNAGKFQKNEMDFLAGKWTFYSHVHRHCSLFSG